MSPQDFVNTVKGRWVLGVTVPVSVALIYFSVGWLADRASAQDVEAAEMQHAADMAEVDGRLDALEPAVRDIQQTTNRIADFLDRKDKAEGGPGLSQPAGTLELLH